MTKHLKYLTVYATTVDMETATLFSAGFLTVYLRCPIAR